MSTNALALYPSPLAFKQLDAAADRLQTCIEQYDSVLGGRPIRESNSYSGLVLVELCEAIFAIQNLSDGGEVLLDSCDVEGYGRQTCREVAEDLGSIAEQVRSICTALRFGTDLGRAVEWRIRSPQQSLWEGVDSLDRCGELLAWWAHRDSVDVAASRFERLLPDSASFWRDAERRLDQLLSDEGQEYSASTCLATLYFGELKHSDRYELELMKAMAIEWARRRRPDFRVMDLGQYFFEPQRNAFGDCEEPVDENSEFEPLGWQIGRFDEGATWPILEDEVKECGSNIASEAWHAYNIIRDHTDVGIAFDWGDERARRQREYRRQREDEHDDATATPFEVDGKSASVAPMANVISTPPAADENGASGDAESKALLLLIQHPDKYTSVAALAREVGCHRGTLSRNDKVKAALSALRSANLPPRGSKSRDGNLEAESD